MPLRHHIRQDFKIPQVNQSVNGTPLTIGSKKFEHGIGTHAPSHIRIYSPEPILGFKASVGVDTNLKTRHRGNAVQYYGIAGRHRLFESPVLKAGDDPYEIDVEVGGETILDLHVSDGGDGPEFDHADWAQAQIQTESGQVLRLDELQKAAIPAVWPQFPFSFTYGGKSSENLLTGWTHESSEIPSDASKTVLIRSWADPETGLKVTWEGTRFADFSALDWVLRFENSGRENTAILEDIRVLDLMFSSPRPGDEPYLLHRTAGCSSSPSDFEPIREPVDHDHNRSLGSGTGRPSEEDLPFFKIETGRGSLLVGVGWTGRWKAELACPDDDHLYLNVGVHTAHFHLRPGEQVRTPRVLILNSKTSVPDANNQFRNLLRRHYLPSLKGDPHRPFLFSNTEFIRQETWHPDFVNADYQSNLIDAFAPLGIRTLFTEAGWMEGAERDWHKGVGNWSYRKENYPDGFSPLAKKASENGLSTGLWFEPETVMGGTEIQKNHPDWLLDASATYLDGTPVFLLNMALPQVREHLLETVGTYLSLEGLEGYLHDFSLISPVEFWDANDAEDRQGVTELQYITGLYEFWDQLAEAHPNSIRQIASRGGQRIDLETISRFHIHQRTKRVFHHEENQAALWGLSQYLPNGVVSSKIESLDEYAFQSNMGASLCLGWRANERGFNHEKAKALTDRHQDVSALLTGNWFPLLPYTRDTTKWMASQYQRNDTSAGCILAFRRSESPYSSVDLNLHGIATDATYELTYTGSGQIHQASGGIISKNLTLTLDEPKSSELITYRKLKGRVE